MSPKALIWIFMTIGSTIGAYIPALWGDSAIFSFSSIFLSAVGGITGIFLGFKLKDYV